MSLLNEPGELDKALAGEDLVGLSVEGGAHAAWELHTHVGHAAWYGTGLGAAAKERTCSIRV